MATTKTKKRLDGLLETMPATEAAVVLASYAADADKKGKVANRQYPPIGDLWRIFDKRVEAARGKPEEGETVAEYNRLVFLDGILTTVNGVDFLTYVQAATFDAYAIQAGIVTLLQQDLTTTLVRQSRRQVIESTPAPVAREAYDRLVAWASADVLETVDDAVELATWDKELDDDQTDAFADKMEETLRDAGDLVEALTHAELWAPVAIVDDWLPAWAALRVYWKPFVFRRGYRIKPEATFWRAYPAPIDVVVDALGVALEDVAVEALARDFLKECRRRPWGKKLVADSNIDDLVGLLLQSATPFFHFAGADFGRVDWKAFATDGDPAKLGDKSFDVEPAATVAGLTKAGRAMGLDVDFSKPWVTDLYYPASSPEYQRGELARLLRQMEALESTRQPFSYDANREPGEMPLNDFLGFEFQTPLEKKARELEHYDAIFLGIREALRVISETYFAGRPILFGDIRDTLERGEGFLREARDFLSAWCDDLEAWPWSINASTLRPAPATEADEETVALLVGRVVKVTASRTRVTPQEVGLPTTSYYGKERGR